MGWTGHGKISSKKRGGRYKFSEKIFYQVLKINTDFMEYVTKTRVKKNVPKTIKHVDPVVHSLKNFTLADAKSLSKQHNDTTSSLDC